MDRDLGFKMVQGQIGYDFKNIDLLNQAFIQKKTAEKTMRFSNLSEIRYLIWRL